MREVLRTNDVAYLSFVSAALRSEGIDALVLDENQSAVDGSIGVIPRRVMVAEADGARAVALLMLLERDVRGG